MMARSGYLFAAALLSATAAAQDLPPAPAEAVVPQHGHHAGPGSAASIPEAGRTGGDTAGTAADGMGPGGMDHGGMEQGGMDHGGHMHAEKPVPTVATERVRVATRVEGEDGAAPRAGQDARVIVTLVDSATGDPVTGQQVFGWMELVRNAQVTAETSCSAKAQLLARGNVTAAADVDLNSYKMVTFSADRTIAVLDPHVDFTITNMERVIPLPGTPFDWTLSGDASTLFVTLPALDLLVGIDTLTLAPIRLIGVERGARPARLLPLPGDRAAVELAGSSSVALVSAASETPSPPVAVGPAPIRLAADAAGGQVFAAAADGRLVAIATATAALAAETRLGTPTTALAWAAEADRLAVAPAGTAEILLLDPLSLAVDRHIALPAPATTLAPDPAGRLLLALDRAGSRVMVIDTAEAKVTSTAAVAEAPVEVGFSHGYAYVRSAGGDSFTAIELDGLRAGRMAPIAVQDAAAPRRAPVAGQDLTARLIAPAGHGALIANPAERVAYDYMEGMNVPMGTVPLYDPTVRGLLAIDRGFRETKPGIYEAHARLRSAGAYETVVALGGPDVTACGTARVESGPPEGIAAHPSRITVSLAEPAEAGHAPAGELRRRRIAWQVVDSSTGAPVTGLKDLRVLAFSPSGAWQKRALVRETGEGRYEVSLRFPGDGRYGLALSAPSQGLGAADGRPDYITIRLSLSGKATEDLR